MMWRIFLLLVAGFWVATMQGAELNQGPGGAIKAAPVPQRVISLLPSLTEMVCALDQCHRLVGVDRYSNYPAQVRALPHLGGGLDPNIEAMVALKPDLVLMADSSAAAAGRLRALGIQVLALEPKTHADVRAALTTLGQVFDVSDPQRSWRDIESGMRSAKSLLAHRQPPTRVYFEVNAAPYAAGESSFIGETLTRLGVKNIVPAHLGAFPKINPEMVVRADPDVLMVSDGTFSGIAGRPGWSRLRAIAQGRVCVFTPEQSDVMVRPGPRMAEAAHAIAKCLKDKAP
jgi:iron complex transport system substrate-binding protein